MEFNKFDYYLGEAMYQARVSKHMTQGDMADLISAKMKENGRKNGITRQAYSFYEKGQRSMSMEIFTYACEVLGLDRNKVFNEACDYIKM